MGSSLKRVNTLLLIVIIAVNGTTLLLPLLPKAKFWQQEHFSNRRQALADLVQAPPDSQALQSKPNALIIPAMLLDQPVNEGPTEKTLRKGLWLRPNSSTPDRGGNTVIVGHRFTYTNPQATFYHLDKVRPGDELAVWWNGAKYVYRTSEVKTVAATTLQIEAPTTEPTLTLYTCTPLWSPKDRLVVIAHPEEEPND